MNTSIASTLPGSLNINPNMKIEKDRARSEFRTNNAHTHPYPVIHIDCRGRILYANKAAFPLLAEWNSLASDYLPDELVNQYPTLLNPGAEFSIKVETKFSRFFLDVIGFRESGYIGLYGFHTTISKAENAYPQ